MTTGGVIDVDKDKYGNYFIDLPDLRFQEDRDGKAGDVVTHLEVGKTYSIVRRNQSHSAQDSVPILLPHYNI